MEYNSIAISFYDNEEDFETELNELDNTPDFTFIGSYSDIEDIYEEFNYQGFNNNQINTLSNNRYGDCIEILNSPNNNYHVYFGAR